MKDTVVSDCDIGMNARLFYAYYTALISPLITVPCPIDTLFPMYTSPTTVALGAMNRFPIELGDKLYNGITALAFEIVYEYLVLASIALVWVQNR